MSGEVDLADELAGALVDRHGSWQFIRRFVNGWYAPLAGGDGWSEEQLAVAVGDLTARYPGVRALPVALAEAYALFGHRRDVTCNQDRFFGPHELQLDDLGEVLVFRKENQGCASWGVHVDELHRDDPPVVMWTDEEPSWRSHADRLSVALVELILSESLMSEGLTDNCPVQKGAGIGLEGQFRPLPLPDLPNWAVPYVRWFTGPDVLLCDHAQTWLWVRARTDVALERLRQVLPGDWAEAGDFHPGEAAHAGSRTTTNPRPASTGVVPDLTGRTGP